MNAPDVTRPAIPWRELFHLDVRSLALLRVGLALLLFSDWLDRVPDLRAHYSDAGIVHRSMVTFPVPLSVHFFTGDTWLAALWVVVALVFAFLLLIGYRTPFVALVSWFLLISVHARTPFVLQGGDQVLRLLLFWGVFLPMGACWSVDAADPRQQRASPRVVGLASVALLLQVCLIYWFAGAWKWRDEWHGEASAVWYALKVDHFTTPFGQWMLQYPGVLALLTRSTMWMERLGPALLLLPFAPALQRMVLIVFFISFHAGLAMTLELGNFPWVCMLAWVALLPTAFWERMTAYFRSPERAGLVVRYNPDRPRARRWAARLRTFLLLGESRWEALPEGSPLGWSVVEAGGTEHTGGEAMRVMASLSPVFGPLAGLLRLPGLAGPTDAFGRWLEGGQGWASAPRRPAWQPPEGGLTDVVLAAFLVYIVLYNFGTFFIARGREFEVPEEVALGQTILPPQAFYFGQALALDQGWGLFAPAPSKYHGWFVMVGVLPDDSRVDLRNGGGPVVWDKPPLLSATYSNGRWRKLIMNLPPTAGYSGLLDAYAAWLFREWNDSHGPDEQLVRVEITWMRVFTEKPGGPAGPVEKGVYVFEAPRGKR